MNRKRFWRRLRTDGRIEFAPIDMYSGTSWRRIKKCFKMAAKRRGCILFMLHEEDYRRAEQIWLDSPAYKIWCENNGCAF
jgi:hypothetical protein